MKTDTVDDGLPTPGGAPEEAGGGKLVIVVPNGFDEKAWDRAVRKMKATQSRLEDKHHRLNGEILPLVYTLGEEAEALVGKKDEGTQRSAVGTLAKALGTSRTRIQQCQAFFRTYSGSELCGLVAAELGVTEIDGKRMCNYLAGKGLSFSHALILCTIRKAKVVHDLITQASEDKLSVRDLQKKIDTATKDKPALLTDSAARRNAQKQASAEKRKSDKGGKKSSGGRITTPVQACEAVIARAEAYQDVSGELLIQFEHVETLDGAEAKKARTAIEEMQAKLVELQETLKANIDSAKKALKKVKG